MAEQKKRPDDFQFRWEWDEASIPPPDHYEYSISIGPGLTGTLEYCPDYPGEGVPVLEKPLAPDADVLDALYRLMESRGIFREDWTGVSNPTPGGETVWLEGTADGIAFRVPGEAAGSDCVAAVYKAIRALAPDSVWEELEAARQEYIQNKY